MPGRRHSLLFLALILGATAVSLVRLGNFDGSQSPEIATSEIREGTRAAPAGETAAHHPAVPATPGHSLPPAPEKPASQANAAPTAPPGSSAAPLPERAERPWRTNSDREALARALRAHGEYRQAAAAREARLRGFPIRSVDADGRTLELVAFENGLPIYHTTFNATVAESIRARSIRGPGRFFATGNGVSVGIWDEARILGTHSEFEPGQVINHHSAPFFSHHSTHVAGTIAARGAHGPAGGMAQKAVIEGYDWNQSLAEMATRAPLYPGEENTISLANHSYGLVAGWFFLGERDAFVFTGFDRFGRYDDFAYLNDVVAHASPYLLSVWAAGNHRSGDPRKDDPVLIDDRVVPYDPDIHPPGDGDYKRGFDTVNSYQISKNVLTVGAIEYLPGSARSGDFDARMTAFSSWGPTDDGRVKPDLVAHGVNVLSPVALDGWYARASGTSMAAPAATGALALLTELHRAHFPGHALRASTLRGLLAHSADDLGNPGPDYRYGWGLINARAAAEILNDYAATPRSRLFLEDTLSTGRKTREYRVTWDADAPLRTTLSWTDPPPEGSVSEPDQSTPTLVNNLHLAVRSPDGAVTHHPYRLDPSNPAAPAGQGINNVDNLLRVDIPAPEPGTYTVRVNYDDTLFGREQAYSLIVTGASVAETETSATQVDFIEPLSGPNNDVVTVQVHGDGFLLGTELRLVGPDESEIPGFGVEINPTRITARFDLYAASPGNWDLEIASPDGDILMLPDAFEVEPACHLMLGEGTINVSSQGGYYTARLETSLPGCPWSLDSNADWLLFLTPRNGQGSTDVIYSIAAHQGSALPRTATIRHEGRNLLTVEQAGVAPVTLTSGTVRPDFITGRERQYDWKYYRVEVPHMQAGLLEVSLAGLSGDADLYVRRGEKPDLSNFDCRPFIGGVQEEFCQFPNPEPGTWWVGVNNWDVGRIDYLISANVLIHSLRYDDWAINSFGPEAPENPDRFGPTADPDNRGVPNLLRYALGLDPETPQVASLPRSGLILDGEDSYPYIEYSQLKAASDITFHIEGSTDLNDWNPVDGVSETVDETATTRTVRFRLSDPATGPDPFFLRLRVVRE